MLHAPVLRYGMPYLRLSDCHVAGLLAMTRKLGRFCLKTDVFYFCGYFLRGVATHCLSNVSFRKLFRFQTFRSGNCSVFPQNLPDLSLRGGRVRPTRQSLTKQFAIPKRTMVARDETEPWNEERKRNDAANSYVSDSYVFAIRISSCFVLPCFATGCHAFGFKIATSLRSSQ